MPLSEELKRLGAQEITWKTELVDGLLDPEFWSLSVFPAVLLTAFLTALAWILTGFEFWGWWGVVATVGVGTIALLLLDLLWRYWRDEPW